MNTSPRFLLLTSMALGLTVWACSSDGGLPPSGDGDGDGDGDTPGTGGLAGDGDGDGDLPGSGGTGDGDGDGDGTGGTGDGDGDGDLPNVTAPAESTTHKDWFKMGDLRLVNNAWGTAEMNAESVGSCDGAYRIFVNADKSFGWDFDRGSCGDGGTQPDYPEVEFGIHPFGTNKSLVTTPDFTSTTLLPLQISQITSASVTIDNMQVSFDSPPSSFNMNFELWVTTDHPVTGTHTGAYSEFMAFWGWESGRWACADDPNVPGGMSGGDFVYQTFGDDTYQLCHMSDTWGQAPNQWRYFQFRVQGGPLMAFDGKLDIKAALDYLVQNQGWSENLWISRFEVGTEIGDNTHGTITMDNVTFEVNGQSRSAVIN